MQGLAAGALTVVGAPKALAEPAGSPAAPTTEGNGRSAVPAAQLAESLALACSWLTDVAQVKTAKLTTESDGGFLHDSWLGSIRGEYTVANRSYLGAGRFRDGYSFRQRKWVTPPGLLSCPGSKENRLLFDDATFLKVWRRTGEARMKDIFYATAEGLLAEEEPSGNWIRYWPCNARTRTLHPRRAYWWGLPFVDAYRDSGLARHLACAIRVGDWYINAMRTDGGMFRDTQESFRTPSFGHETSGICCAMIIWHELALLDDSPRWRAASDQALHYCLRGQFREVRDPNLRGAILEQVRPPDGTDSSPYHLRDLSTIFYAQAVSRMLGRPTALH